MISTEIYLEDNKIDLLQDISTEFTYSIDDVNDFGSRNTSFSKTISIPGTALNNKLFGYIFDMTNANFTDNNLPNIGYNYNVSKEAFCKIFIDKIQIFKGTLRILEIVVDKETIEYQCSVFGELGGFINQLANKRLAGNENPLDDLDFSAYNHVLNTTNISTSWNNAGGSGYYYPLIDYGGVSTGVYGGLKVDFQYTTFRPALYVKQYIEKIFAGTDYTFNCDFFSTALFKRLIIPNNQTGLTYLSTGAVNLEAKVKQYNSTVNVEWVTGTLGNFTLDGTGYLFTYTASASLTTNIRANIAGLIINQYPYDPEFDIRVIKNGVIIYQDTQSTGYMLPYDFVSDINLTGITFNTGDTFYIQIYRVQKTNILPSVFIHIETSTPTPTRVNLGDTVIINDTIPRGIFQRDFFLSIVKMFNLYVYENKFNKKELIISPFVDFYPEVSANAADWSLKIDRAKPLSIKPMSELNARYYNYKFKSDNDYFAENYRKKYTEGYGDYIFDTEFNFSKNTDNLELIFSSSILYKAVGTDKVYPAIYKKSNSNNSEDAMDSVIRILQAKKVTGVSGWQIMNGASNLGAFYEYGYAGHLDDPNTPTNDINFGVPKEIQFTTSGYPSTNVFNAFHSPYMAEITSKDSKLLTCSALLSSLDIFNLDFSKYIWIDGVLFRLNKVDSFNPMEYNTTKISLLKVIETTY